MAWTWDVNDTLPTGATHDTPAIRSINLMCYLLHDVQYSLLYEAALENALGNMILNLDNLPGYLNKPPTGDQPPIQVPLKNHLQAIRTRLTNLNPADHDRVIARNFFERQYGPVAPTHRHYHYHLTNRELESLRANPILNHFCIPFYAVQHGAQPLPSGKMDNFLLYLRGKTLFQLFTESKHDYSTDEKKAIRDAKDDGILTSFSIHSPGRGDAYITTVNLGNDYICDNDGCIPNNTTWCSEDSNGNCTAISDCRTSSC